MTAIAYDSAEAKINSLQPEIDAELDALFPQLLDALRGLVAIPSVRGAALPGAPFGADVRRALDYTLDLCRRHGLDATDVDGYAGFADLPGCAQQSGSSQVAILGHLDVVPAAAADWQHYPFTATLDNGRMYGRGTMDDKGPLLAALFGGIALRRVGFIPQRPVRFLFGCNEETGMSCMEYYLNHYDPPALGFTPDSSFPLVVGEKGICQFELCWPRTDAGADPAAPRLLNAACGSAMNIVPAKAEAVLYWPEKLTFTLPPAVLPGKLTVTRQGDSLTLLAEGRAAHASTPEQGENALALLLDALSRLLPRDALLLRLAQLTVDPCRGVGFGLDGADAHSQLTLAPTTLALTQKQARLGCDLRFPVTHNGVDYLDKLKAIAAPDGAMELIHLQDPLFQPADGALAQTLLRCYRDVSHDMSDPLVIGGGTYAKTIRNMLAFGPEVPGAPMLAHQADEYIDCSELLAAAKIYARAIARLSYLKED